MMNQEGKKQVCFALEMIVFVYSVSVKSLLYRFTCRVWPNTAGVTLEQKVDLLPLCHLAR